MSGDSETAGIDDLDAAEYRKEFNPEAAMDSQAMKIIDILTNTPFFELFSIKKPSFL